VSSSASWRKGHPGLLGAPDHLVGAAGALRDRDRLRAERPVGIDQRGVEPGVVGQVAPPELRVDPLLEAGPGTKAHPREHEDASRVPLVAAGRRADRVTEPAPGRHVRLRSEDEIRGLPDQLDARSGRTRLGGRGPPLR